MKKVLSLSLLVSATIFMYDAVANIAFPSNDTVELQCFSGNSSNIFRRHSNGEWKRKTSEETWEKVNSPSTTGTWCEMCEKLIAEKPSSYFKFLIDEDNNPIEESIEEVSCS